MIGSQYIRELVADGFEHRRAEWKRQRIAKANPRPTFKRTRRPVPTAQGSDAKLPWPASSPVSRGCDSEEHF